jgi:hypothetical protein
MEAAAPSLPRRSDMSHFADKIHFAGKETLDRVETVVVLGFIGSGLAACAIGAFVYDVGQALSIW